MKKKIILAALMAAAALATFAQRVEGNRLIMPTGGSRGAKVTATALRLDHDKDTIFIGGKGSAFVWRVSKNTGKRYRKYLGKEASAAVLEATGKK